MSGTDFRMEDDLFSNMLNLMQQEDIQIKNVPA